MTTKVYGMRGIAMEDTRHAKPRRDEQRSSLDHPGRSVTIEGRGSTTKL